MMAATRRPLGEQTNTSPERHNRPNKVRVGSLPPAFLSINVADTDDAMEAADASPDMLTTTLSLHASSMANALDVMTIALTEILYEREAYPRDIFREVSKFGLATHRLGSIHTASADNERLSTCLLYTSPSPRDS